MQFKARMKGHKAQAFLVCPLPLLTDYQVVVLQAHTVHLQEVFVRVAPLGGNREAGVFGFEGEDEEMGVAD
jgi:hypothetical protein